MTADAFLRETLDGKDVETRWPVGVTATRAALKNSRGEANGALRLVELTWDSVPPASDAGDFVVAGPKDGRPLIVNIRSGFPRLVIESGNVVIMAESGAGHSINVEGSAHTTILCGAGRKVSSTTTAGGTTDVYLDEAGWGSHRAEDGGTLTLHGVDRVRGVRRRRGLMGSSKRGWPRGGRCRVGAPYISGMTNFDSSKHPRPRIQRRCVQREAEHRRRGLLDDGIDWETPASQGSRTPWGAADYV